MSLKVIGAGFGRTGTLSLKAALEILGFGPCYHMVEVFKHPGHAEAWSAAADGNVDWEKLLAGYPSTVDWPSTSFWRELTTAYPEAKVILTVRSTESWVKSAQNTIFKNISEPVVEDGSPRAAQRRMAQRLVRDNDFGGNLEDPEHIGKVFEAHNEEVRRTIAAERLLVYESGQGWEPLCRFLGVPVPAVEYPKTNSTEEFQARVAAMGAEKH
ncbi:MAG TPA: sulfotransferase [Polyangium sp.]|nr:sulfotransferase [Polyangium sp.]